MPALEDVTRDVTQSHDYALILSNSDGDPDKQSVPIDTLVIEGCGWSHHSACERGRP